MSRCCIVGRKGRHRHRHRIAFDVSKDLRPMQNGGRRGRYCSAISLCRKAVEEGYRCAGALAEKERASVCTRAADPGRVAGQHAHEGREHRNEGSLSREDEGGPAKVAANPKRRCTGVKEKRVGSNIIARHQRGSTVRRWRVAMHCLTLPNCDCTAFTMHTVPDYDTFGGLSIGIKVFTAASQGNPSRLFFNSAWHGVQPRRCSRRVTK